MPFIEGKNHKKWKEISLSNCSSQKLNSTLLSKKSKKNSKIKSDSRIFESGSQYSAKSTSCDKYL